MCKLYATMIWNQSMRPTFRVDISGANALISNRITKPSMSAYCFVEIGRGKVVDGVGIWELWNQGWTVYLDAAYMRIIHPEIPFVWDHRRARKAKTKWDETEREREGEGERDRKSKTTALISLTYLPLGLNRMQIADKPKLGKVWRTLEVSWE